MARYLPNIAFAVTAGIEMGLLATGDHISQWAQINWIGLAGAWAILAAFSEARSRG